ncbi:hypothetical protein ACHHYP_14830 [Achlya hypogyna]|uniref:Uncharacterized protein n=1 Tax=Achlya hypogyna TaxID=1202772 RepID=A0A1V9YC81_ACHHY|nr:hypothetical protein ACHHYP_14830 [Achlya hypogyna]
MSSTGGGSAHGTYIAHDRLVGSAVVVRLRNLSFVQGALFSLDPESGLAVLFVLDTDTPGVRTQAIMADAIASIEAATDDAMDIAAISTWIDAHGSDGGSEQTSEETRAALQAFLTTRCIESIVTSDGSLSLFGGAATIGPPFDAYAIVSQNDFVAQRLSSLLKEWESSSPLS